MNERYAKGLAVRKQVLGGSQVEATVKAAESALNEGLQKYLTEFVWGDIWSREQLSLRDRSLVTLGMLTALNRSVELKTHIRGALNNGLTMDEIARFIMLNAVDRPVLNKTEVDGRFNFDLDFTRGLPNPESPIQAGDRPPAASTGTSIFTAVQEQLGLKLEATRSSLEVVVVDAVARPEPD